MERCLWISPGETATTDRVEKHERVFIGDEACGRFLSSADLLDAVNAHTHDGRRMGIIFPYLDPEREIDFVTMLGRLNRQTEIVVNDVGAFRLVKKSNHIPILGRLLTRQCTDPAIASFFGFPSDDRIAQDGAEIMRLKHKPPPPELSERFAGSPVFSKEAAALFLSGYSHMTVMLDLLPHGMPREIPENYSVMLNTDNILVSVMPCRSCNSCPQKEVLLGTVRGKTKIYRKRNTIYYKRADVSNAEDAGNVETPKYVTRLICQL